MNHQISPIFQFFDQQYHLAKKDFDTLSKQFKSKKAIDLEERLIYLEIYTDLLSRIHFDEKKLKFQLFNPFKPIFKCLKMVLHIKLTQKALLDASGKKRAIYGSYEQFLNKEKNKLYISTYDLIISTPLEIWDELYKEAYDHSIGLKPLMINTSTTQIINEELDFFKYDSQKELGPKEIKDIYEGLQVIITLENLRMVTGLNSTFTHEIHQKMNILSHLLYSWYQNHLFLQHLIFYLAQNEEIPDKKYLQLLDKIKQHKKKLTTQVVSQCQYLFTKVLI
ncbi:hypothetical protein QWY93_10400 [Echinicola jeungdonensis]|uniref:Uncharacterized protein n=1 Tax=Echinicola jeungdonensis TaxID=709343 RepID=A0ABV5JA52_9BACT|nr:hypothetical protein [Echinicola jeungdonensis]MDN3669734.1 hypothetical protein [Echinicola jeungdonensis]